MKPAFIYNFVRVAQIVLGLLFQILLGRYFGASMFADIYFISMVIISFLSTLGAFFTDYFMQYYNDLKVVDETKTKRFYQTVFNWSLLVGIGLFMIAMILEEPVMRFFVSGLDSERIQILKSFLSIVLFSLILTRLISLNNILLNAEMKFMLPYLVDVLTPIFNIGALLVFSRSYGINALAVSVLVSGITGLLIQQVYISKVLGIRLGVVFWHKDLKKLIKNSFSLNIGHQIWNLKDPITTNILSHFPSGTISIYFYAVRIISVIHSVTYAPAMQIFSSKVSRLVSENNVSNIRKFLKETVVMNVFLFGIALIPFVIVLPEILSFFFAEKFSKGEIKNIHLLFLMLIPFYLILTTEGPFTSITIAMKQSFKVIKIGTAFILIYGVILFLLTKIIGVYSIPIALAIAQSQNLIAYRRNVKKILESALNKPPQVCLEVKD